MIFLFFAGHLPGQSAGTTWEVLHIQGDIQSDRIPLDVGDRINEDVDISFSRTSDIMAVIRLDGDKVIKLVQPEGFTPNQNQARNCSPGQCASNWVDALIRSQSNSVVHEIDERKGVKRTIITRLYYIENVGSTSHQEIIEEPIQKDQAIRAEEARRPVRTPVPKKDETSRLRLSDKGMRTVREDREQKAGLTIEVAESLRNRGIMRSSRPKPSAGRTGRIVVSVCVDADGNVVSAFAKGALWVDPELEKIAVTNAKTWKFNRSRLAKQCGTITYKFE